jgi:hypothetical protein
MEVSRLRWIGYVDSDNLCRQHVFRDLQPYCCTNEHCTIADRLYDSRKAWFAHELEAHRTAWQCVEECDKTFQVEAHFEAHVQKSHPDLTSPSMLSALKRVSAKSADLGGQTHCALCDKPMALRALQRHLGSHQQQLALFSLPSNLDDTTDDPNDDDDEESLIAGNDQEEELSDLSDTSDTEDVEDVVEFQVGDTYSDELMEITQTLQKEHQSSEEADPHTYHLPITQGPPGIGKSAVVDIAREAIGVSAGTCGAIGRESNINSDDSVNFDAQRTPCKYFTKVSRTLVLLEEPLTICSGVLQVWPKVRPRPHPPKRPGREWRQRWRTRCNIASPRDCAYGPCTGRVTGRRGLKSVRCAT